MGGKKKQSLRQMAKAQEKKDKKTERKLFAKLGEKNVPRIFPPDSRSKKVIEEVKKMKVLTPNIVATRFNLRLSAAKELLKELERRRIIEYVSGSKNIKIYVFPTG